MWNIIHCMVFNMHVNSRHTRHQLCMCIDKILIFAELVQTMKFIPIIQYTVWISGYSTSIILRNVCITRVRTRFTWRKWGGTK